MKGLINANLDQEPFLEKLLNFKNFATVETRATNYKIILVYTSANYAIFISVMKMSQDKPHMRYYLTLQLQSLQGQ